MARITSFKFTLDKSVEERAAAILVLRPDLSLEEAMELARQSDSDDLDDLNEWQLMEDD